MMGLLRVPFFQDETLVSFASRMAQANGRDDLRKFLADLGIKPLKVSHGDEAEVSRLADLFGMPADTLRSRSVKVAKDGSMEFAGTRFSRLALVRTQFRVCTHCLAEDEMDTTRMPGTRRYARSIWMIPSVTSCCRHHRELVTLDVPAYAIPDFCRVLALSQEKLAAHESMVAERRATDFEVFVARRLDGVHGYGDILDRVSLTSAIDLCQILGLAARNGRKFTLREGGGEELPEVLDEGFLALRAGEKGVMEVLDRVAEERSHGSIRGGYALYGSLYFTLLQPLRRGDEYEPVRELVRKHARERMAILPDARVFQKMDDVRWTSINSVVKQTGLHPNTVQKYIAKHFPRPAGTELETEKFVSADVAASAIEALGDTISLPEAATLLAWSIHDCRRLVATGILRPIVDGPGLQPRYARSAVLRLKADLLARATARPEGMMSLRQVSMRFHSGQEDILKAVFDGRLSRLAYSDAPSLLDSVKVDPPELLEIASELVLEFKMVCRELRLERTTLAWLVEHGAFPSAKLLGGVPAVEVVAFARRYVTTAEVKSEHGVRRGDFDKRLKRSGVEMAFPFAEIGQMILRREDVSRVLQG
ncbi:hypothetical protein E5S70_26900 [Ensifer adhaerens]|uniref:TniQ family protein n=1 Tax=Ensifer canadensis TaxID=555315 RepID=UPI0014906448|nr:TniQ family protein [Ensifer canadensis]NOV19659.1 hypothetical protein [Ensifer canadensis]